MRSPVSALIFAIPERGCSASAKPSVMRVEAKTAPDEISPAKSVLESGEPFGAHTRRDEKLAYRLRSFVPTWTCGSVSASRFEPFTAMKAKTELPTGICDALPRMPLMLSVAVPVEERLKLTPLYVTSFDFVSTAGTVTACGPDPVSIVN